MIEYYCGYPQCGKSAVAEKALAQIPGPVAYVGTLPNIRMYWGTIREHRRRRPAQWELYECVGALGADLDCLRHLLDRYNGILLDGGTFYLHHQLQWGYSPCCLDLRQSARIMRYASRSAAKLIVVDQPVGSLPEGVRQVGRAFHRLLYRYSLATYYVESGELVPAGIKELERLDGIGLGNEGDGNDDDSV